jgi:hypothetical protein
MVLTDNYIVTQLWEAFQEIGKGTVPREECPEPIQMFFENQV